MRFTSILVAAMAAIASSIPTDATSATVDSVKDDGYAATFTLTGGDMIFCLAECAEFCVVPGDYWCQFCIVGCMAFYQHHPKTDEFDPKSIPELTHNSSTVH